MDLQLENQLLREEVENLKKELLLTQEHLKKYTAPQKEYYEKNKDIIKQKASQNNSKLKETNPEKIKEYAHRAYLKQKEKKKLKEIVTI
jgi:Ni,Fe-hydrogenase I large subunit